MNYYTLKGVNANKFFKLNLKDESYFDWEYVKNKAVEIMNNINDDKERDEIESNISSFQEIIDARKRREKSLKNEFDKKNIKFINHSYIVRNHIMYGKKTTADVVRIMYMMKILFEKCNILNRWEEHKVKIGNQVYSFKEKDDFYKKTYDEFIKKNPKLKL